MGIGISIFLIAVGAVLAFAIHVSSSGVDLNTVGVILMIVGGVGLFATLIMFGGPGFGGVYRRSTYVEDGVAPAGRRVVRRTYVDDVV